MLLKESWLTVADATNVRFVKIFHLYKGFWRKTTTQSFFIKSSARIVEPPRIEYKGFKYKYNVKGDICRLIITKIRVNVNNKGGGFTKFNLNSGIAIKKKSEPKSKYLKGPVSRYFLRKRFITLFKESF